MHYFLPALEGVAPNAEGFSVVRPRQPALQHDGTPLKNVIMGSHFKKIMCERDMLQLFGNLFLVGLLIYQKFERI